MSPYSATRISIQKVNNSHMQIYETKSTRYTAHEALKSLDSRIETQLLTLCIDTLHPTHAQEANNDARTTQKSIYRCVDS